MLQAANTSLGVALLADLVERAAAVLGAELGHRDPGRPPPHEGRRAVGHRAGARRGGGARPRRRRQAERGRDGTGLKRGDGAIGFAALRGGTVAGDHDVHFLGPDERLILSHRAESRAIFARGALAGARFLIGQPAGLYTMRDVIDSL